MSGELAVIGQGKTHAISQYVEIYPIPTKMLQLWLDVRQKEFFSRYGVPNFLHSDQGTQFESKLFAEICVLLGITKTRMTI